MPQYRNPVIPGFHPDPSICWADGFFYLVTSSFEYFPGIPIFRSVDLVHWTQIGHVLDRPSQLHLEHAPDSGGIFAPTIRHHAGRFYVTGTNVSDRGHFIVSTDDPSGAWSDPIWVDQNGIDPSLSFIDGRVLFQSNVEPAPGGAHELVPDFTRGIQQSEIDLATGEILFGPEFIWSGSGGRFPEGPHLYRRGDWYYLVAAEGGTEWGHIATVARARSPWGPFESSPHGPILDHRSVVSPFQAVGHADLIELADGSWWAVCLGIRPEGGWPHHLLGRETLLAPVSWTDDGWPVIGAGGVVPETHDVPFPHLEQQQPTESGGASFPSGGDLDPAWVTVRTPLDDAAWTARPEHLVLRPRGAELSGARPCFLGRRQEHKSFRARTRVRIDTPDASLRAGLVVRMNSEHFIALAASGGARGELRLELEQRIGSLRVVTPLGSVRGDAVDLEVAATPGEYRFSATGQDGEELHAPPVAARLISTEMASGFTGAFVGMFADGDRSDKGTAEFDLFDYERGAATAPRDAETAEPTPVERAVLPQPARV